MTAAAFLGVERSATGRRWVGPGAEVERLGLAIAQAHGLPEIVGRVLAARGVTPEGAPDFLDPTLKALMPDPSALADMDVAAERLARAVTEGERIAIFGDYDVDGGASVALILDWLGQMDLGATPYIPDRIDEGYGPNVPAMEALAAAHDLILCVDCGTLSFEPVAAARAMGADVIIADHHLADETLPEALAVVNPNRQDDTSGMGYLCAAGVVLLMLVAANRVLRGHGAFGARAEPDLMDALDLTRRTTGIVSGDTLEERKPHPAPLLHACDLIGSKPGDCLYVGDAERDIEAGHNAGMTTLVAMFGYLMEQDRPETWVRQR